MVSLLSAVHTSRWYGNCSKPHSRMTAESSKSGCQTPKISAASRNWLDWSVGNHDNLKSAGSVNLVRADPPNIILIMVDDLGKEWVGCYGAENIRTPQIDSLAESGMRFYPFRHGWVSHLLELRFYSPDFLP